jgi:predicted nucleic-acid-binding protein
MNIITDFINQLEFLQRTHNTQLSRSNNFESCISNSNVFINDFIYMPVIHQFNESKTNEDEQIKPILKTIPG